MIKLFMQVTLRSVVYVVRGIIFHRTALIRENVGSIRVQLILPMNAQMATPRQLVLSVNRI